MNTVNQVGLLLVVLLNGVQTTEEPEPTFRIMGRSIEMGFCFGADYIVVYRSSSDGDLLLANSSEPRRHSPLLPANISDRVSFTTDIAGLLGLELRSLRLPDSGVYRRECWQDEELGRQGKYHLMVCLHEMDPLDILLLPGGSAELFCNHTSNSQGRTIRWYRETYPEFTRTLFLDTSQSMEPLQDDLKGHLQVCNNGSSLHISSTALKFSKNFYCMLLEGDNCLSYQKMQLPLINEPDVRTVLRLTGEEVMFSCSSEYTIPELLFWDTPLGIIDWESGTATNKMPERDDPDSIHKTYKFDKDNYAFVIPLLSEEHSGQYKCFSPLPVKEYSLTVCPTIEPITTSFIHGDKAVLICNPGLQELYRVQWYRRRGPEMDELLLDTKDPQVPEEMRGRVTMSKLDFSLSLSNLSVEDQGEYFCAVLDDGDYPFSYDLDVLPDSGFEEICAASQTHHLLYVGEVTARHATSSLYVVWGALAGCVLLGVAVVVLLGYWVTKRWASRRLRDPSKQPGPQDYDREPNEEIACNQRLDPTLHNL